MFRALIRVWIRLNLSFLRSELDQSVDELAQARIRGDTDTAAALLVWIRACKAKAAAYERRLTYLESHHHG